MGGGERGCVHMRVCVQCACVQCVCVCLDECGTVSVALVSMQTRDNDQHG